MTRRPPCSICCAILGRTTFHLEIGSRDQPCELYIRPQRRQYPAPAPAPAPASPHPRTTPRPRSTPHPRYGLDVNERLVPASQKMRYMVSMAKRVFGLGIRTKVIEFLLRLDNVTPLHLAAAKGAPAPIDALLSAGADRALTNSLGETAFDFALAAFGGTVGTMNSIDHSTNQPAHHLTTPPPYHPANQPTTTLTSPLAHEPAHQPTVTPPPNQFRSHLTSSSCWPVRRTSRTNLNICSRWAWALIASPIMSR